MKKILFGVLALLITSASFISFHRTELPPPPVICAELSPKIPMNFKISKIDMTEVEVQLDAPGASEDFFMQLRMGDSWKGGRTGLKINGCSKRSRMKTGTTCSDFKHKMKKRKAAKTRRPAKNDFTTFMASKRGQDVDVYEFEYTLTQGKDGILYLKKTYVGPDMPLLNVLEINESVPVPKFISKRFTKKGTLSFIPGNVGLDQRDNSYWIPVKLERG